MTTKRPSRQSKEQNNYFDNPVEMLQDLYKELDDRSVQAYDYLISLLTEREIVLRAINEAGGGDEF